MENLSLETAFSPFHGLIPLPIAFATLAIPITFPLFLRTFPYYYFKHTLRRTGSSISHLYICCCSVTQLCPTLRPHGLQHARLPCPSLFPGVCSNSCPLSRWWIKMGFPGGAVVKNHLKMQETQVQSLGQRKWQPTPVFLPGEPHGQRNLGDYSSWGCKTDRHNNNWIKNNHH